MEDNSIRSNLSKDDIISDISLCMGADIHRENIYLLVEGGDDICLLRSYVSENVLLYESYDGKNGVEVIVNEHFADEKRVIGIRDKDYEVTTTSEKIFYYDGSCMEMMLMANDEIFNNLCFEYYHGKKSSNVLRQYILEQLKYLSVIRRYNEREKSGLLLNGVSLSYVCNEGLTDIDNELIIQKVNSMNNNFLTPNVLQKIQEDYIQAWDEEQYFSYTRGHDFTMLFAILCNVYRKKGVKYTEIEASARCAFRWSDFAKTCLHHKLVEYERKMNISLMKSMS